MGYFATLYRRMTVAVQQGILNNMFEEAARMEQLDVHFANRYITAWDAYVNHRSCSKGWTTAFDACNNASLVVLQHLILGINTHINLDLSIAAALTCPGEKIYGLQKDFEKINDVIADLSQKVQDSLANIWFPLRTLQKITNKREEPVLNFSINSARKASWANAVALALIQGPAHENYIIKIDALVAEIANRIINPGVGMRLLLRPVNWMESRKIGNNISHLQN